MAKIPRKFLKLFGSSGPTDDFAQFGSRAAAAPQFSKDPDTIQSLTAWLGGIKSSLLSGVRAMFAEDLNSVLYVLSHGLCNFQQDGIPEWNTDTPYYIGSIVRKVNTFELYGSLTDDNAGNALPNKTNNTNWQYLNPPAEAPGVVKATIAATAPFGYLPFDGSSYLKASYPDLYAIGGACIIDVDADHFKLIDLRGRTIVGVGTGDALTARTLGQLIGAETHTNLLGNHKHKTTILRRTSDSSLIVKQTGIFGEGDVSVDATGGAGFGAGAAPNPNKAHLTDNPEGAPSTGVGSSMQPSVGLNWIIKY